MNIQVRFFHLELSIGEEGLSRAPTMDVFGGPARSYYRGEEDVLGWTLTANYTGTRTLIRIIWWQELDCDQPWP